MHTCSVHLTSLFDILQRKNVNGLALEQNVTFKSKHVRVHSETKCVRHSELTGHPVPIQPSYRWLADTFPAVLLYYPDPSAAHQSICQVLPVTTHLNASLEREEMQDDSPEKH